MGKMSLDERLDMHMESIRLKREGKIEESKKVLRQIPYPPYLAKIIKEEFGADVLIDGGFNLCEANEEFGEGWLFED